MFYTSCGRYVGGTFLVQSTAWHHTLTHTPTNLNEVLSGPFGKQVCHILSSPMSDYAESHSQYGPGCKTSTLTFVNQRGINGKNTKITSWLCSGTLITFCKKTAHIFSTLVQHFGKISVIQLIGN